MKAALFAACNISQDGMSCYGDRHSPKCQEPNAMQEPQAYGDYFIWLLTGHSKEQ